MFSKASAFILVAIGIATADSPSDKDEFKAVETRSLEGKWGADSTMVVFNGYEHVWRHIGGPEMESGTYVVGQAGEIDLAYEKGPLVGKTLKGIYKIEGDILRFCFARPGKDRPTEFKERSDRLIWSFRRLKP